MRLPRSSGVLLHPTSLPSLYGIGELGRAAHSFIDWLDSAGQSYWQVLPLGPTGYGDSPYQSFSSFGGNPLLIDLEALVVDGYLTAGELAAAPAGARPPVVQTAVGNTGDIAPDFAAQRVDYGAVIPWKHALLRRAALSFKQAQRPGHLDEFHRFCDENARWLDDYALFAALKDRFGGAVWNNWPRSVAHRQKTALERWGKELGDDVLRVKFLQWQFFRQWQALKAHAHALGIQIIGDLPIFVAYDSADVWAHPDLFYLDEAYNPTAVAGVPPDYFSETGQLWGNPLYRWDIMAERGYDWWIERVRATLAGVDIVRMDHFRGFEAYWEVPAGEPTAVKGRWVPGPGEALFDALQDALAEAKPQPAAAPRGDTLRPAGQEETALPIIAEDLGVITPPVIALRERYHFPGMKILQFAFGPGADNPLPHTFERNCVVYTGTHDNDTAMGWFAGAGPETRQHALDYMGTDGHDFAWDLIRLGSLSVANAFVVPMQDLLSLGGEARMNFPSKASGNWGWRMSAGAATPELAERLRKLTELYGRYTDRLMRT